jgi:hypothetical protein
MMPRRKPNRRGYALIMVAVFCVLFVTFMGVAWHRMASTIYTFSARSTQMQQDQGMIMALADAMRALEVGLPPLPPSGNPDDPYRCWCRESVPVMQNVKIKPPIAPSTLCSTEPRYYDLTFTTTQIAEGYTVTVTVTPRNGPPVAGSTTPTLDINTFGNYGRSP